MVRLVVLASVWFLCEAVAAAEELQSVRYSARQWTTPEATTSTARRPRRLQRRARRAHPAFELRIGDSHQLETDLDDGGQMSVNRFVAQARVGWEPASGPRGAVTLTYRLHAHSFSGQGAAFPARPWTDVHQVSLTAPLFVPVGPRWTVRAISEIRTAFEDGDAWDEGVSGGGIYGATYRVNRRLTIGPAIGVLTQIEDDPLVFPFAFVEWRICNNLLLRSGRAITATQGFGVFLEWDPSRAWRVTLGGRSERLRFRLNDRGVAPGGVGEHAWTSVFLALTNRCDRHFRWTVSVGTALAGELRVEDRRGNLIAKDEYDAAAYVAFDMQIDF